MNQNQIISVRPERWAFVLLLITQIVFVALTPIINGSSFGRWVRLFALFAILISGVYAASVRKGFLVVALFLMLPALFAWLGPDLLSPNIAEVSRLLSAAACFTFTAVVVSTAVVKHENVTAETIIGGIDAYLLIGLTFMLLHMAVLIGNPDAYDLGGQPMKEFLISGREFHGFSTMLYFSFTTLTTLGYGDIVPKTSWARLLTSAEAVIGQLYVAIFIARLVSLQVSQRMTIRK